MPASQPSASSGRARHPRSRAERELLSQLTSSIDRAHRICESGAGNDALRLLASSSSAYSRSQSPPQHRASSARLASNGSSQPSLFYAPPPVSGVGIASRGQPFAGAPRAGLSVSDDEVLRHYGVQQLSEYARHELLGAVSDYLPSYREESAARTRFNTLLARVQQHQLARTVQNELRARKQPDAAWNWDERRFHLAPVTGHSKRVVPVGAWAEFIRKGGDPSQMGLGLDIVPDVLAERHLPSMSGMQYAW